MKSLIKKDREIDSQLSKLLPENFHQISDPFEIFAPDNYVQKNGSQTVLTGIRGWIVRNIWKFLISPLVLMASLLIYSTIPTEIFKERLQIFVFSVSNRTLKRLSDIVGSMIGLIICSVFFLVLPVLIKLDSGGPVFCCEQRIGINRRKKSRRKIDAETWEERRSEDRRKFDLGGKPFYVFYFRIVRENSVEKGDSERRAANAPGITTSGRILRYLNLEKFPQLFNIISGDMSFVGPKPVSPQTVARFLAEIPYYRERMKVKPGLTGFAQLRNGYDHSVENAKTMLEYDLLFCKNASYYLYMKILLLTIFQIIFKKGS